jgi:predicted peroxiredoxin
MRRRFLSLFLALPGLGLATAARAQPKMKVLIKSAWGSADPTQASFPFHHANAFADAGHDVQIFLLGEAVTLMRTAVANAVTPVGWAPLSEALAGAVAKKISIHV